jgi:hypothetical protein
VALVPFCNLCHVLCFSRAHTTSSAIARSTITRSATATSSVPSTTARFLRTACHGDNQTVLGTLNGQI